MHSVMNIVKGVTIGLVAGAAVGFVGKELLNKNPKARKRARKTVRSFGNAFGTAQYMFK